MTRIKVCGMTRARDVRLACRLGAWAVGFVFAKSPRRVTIARARTLRRSVKRGVLAVGVFADAPREQVKEAAAKCRLDLVQLHGREKPEDCRGLGAPVIKAVGPANSLKELQRFKVKRFLVEPGRSVRGRFKGAKLSPARMKAAWAFARRARKHQVILAGGLSAGSVAGAIKAARPYAVDVSSGVESSPGRKDAAKLRAFFEAVKNERGAHGAALENHGIL